MSGIKIREVTKTYKDTKALDHVSVQFEEGKIYALLGRNGAGKSTLLNIISNRIFSDEGEVLVEEMPARENDQVQQKIYLMSEQTLYPTGMKVQQAFRWSKEFYPEFDMSYAMELSERFGLSTKKKIKALSTGYKSIFKLIVALSVNVPYLFLDEPVLGLDANHREMFYRILLEKYIADPFTIVISTHLIEEIASVIEHVVILKEGKVIEDCATEELLAGGYRISGKQEAVDTWIQGEEVIGTEMLGTMKTAYIIGSSKGKWQDVPEELDVAKLDLQKMFIQMTNRQRGDRYENEKEF